MQTDRADLTAALDDKDPRTSRIIFQDKKREDQGLPAAGTSVHSVEADVTNPEEGFQSEYICSLPPRRTPTRTPVPLSSEEGADDTIEVEGEPESTPSGVCQRRYVICLPLTPTSSEGGWQAHRA